jgi:hypothetical protein
VSSSTAKQAIGVELFPVIQSRIPSLRAFDVQSGNLAPSIAGGRLAYRLGKELGDIWVWTGSRVVTDSTSTEGSVRSVLERLWTSQPTVFGDLRGLRLATGWQPTTSTLADFVGVGVVRKLDRELRRTLPERVDLGSLWAERVYDARGWEILGQPAVSISVSSRLIHKQLLPAYAGRLASNDDLVRLMVYDVTGSLKGEIEGVVGRLKDHRARLSGVASRPEMLDLLAKAPDDEQVVRVISGRAGYDYPLSALGLIVRSSDFRRFGVNGKRALSVLKIPPAARWTMVMAVSEPLRRQGWIGEAFRSDGPGGGALGWYTGTAEIGLRFGGGATAPYDTRSLLGSLKRHGLLRVLPKFMESPIRIGVLDMTGSPSLAMFLRELSAQIQSLHLRCEYENIPSSREISRASIEGAVDEFARRNLDLLLTIFPNEPGPDDYDSDDATEWGPYQTIKSLTVGRGIPSQFAFEGTLAKPFAVANVALGVLGKTGNVPFALSRPIKGVDLVVGLDIARERKTRLPGSINATAVARIYLGDGELLRYVIHDAPIEGETIPDSVLHSLFPRRDFERKRAIIHRDGLFRGGEAAALHRWARDIGATFHLVEVIKSGSPRVYALTGAGATMPEKGMLVRLSSTEVLLVSSPPAFKDATPNPLRIRTDGSLSLEDALESVIALTTLHYGSLRPPRLPVTLHYSDRIAYLALRGIKPKDLEGTVPFWL